MNRPITVIGVLGSPHRHGNTEILLDTFLKGATEAGGVAEKVILSKLSYSSCKGCNACHKTGDCIMQDEIHPVFERMLDADCLAVSSPIYTMGITTELKGFIDRAHYIWVRHFKLKTHPLPPEKKVLHRGYFLSTAGMDREDVFATTFPMMQALFNIFGFSYCADILAKDMDGSGGIYGRPDILEMAYQNGYEAVRGIQKKEPCKR
ncbi:MAG: flavodoxin family protein [Methanospirillum sp.]|uniref:flavodoxin family protein n=1 Tax=Methanospirillum sp. TaxID=45200 RepID=UPI00237110ED|nr:flavodoxin family protein [Methanospirillum sp.]MDD1729603.1 flavodoxin family protein [Methanospirillum sp.]